MMNNKPDATCGDPTCTHDWCKKARDEKAAKHEQAVNDVAAALKQVLSVNPQLLYEAAVKVGSEATVEHVKLMCEPTPEKRQELLLTRRTALCTVLTTALLRAGLAQVTEKELAGLASYLTLVDKLTSETKGRLNE